MASHSIAEATRSLPELIERALHGEDVVITREGRPVVEIRAIGAPIDSKPITVDDLDWLANRRLGRGRASVDSGTFVSRMRDEDWG